ncbi:MAG: carbohydrate ABC transporter permease [Lachnospiraceae bacterium]|nr:carbohydrate ABC transporter permease [Lachnospiraceae bacterium]
MGRTRKIRESLDNRIFDGVVTILLTICGLAALYPLLFVVVASISDPVRVNSGDVWLYPVGFQLDGYLQVFRNKWIFVGYRNSLIYTILGTFLNVLVTIMAGYALSRKDLYGRKIFSWFIAIPMWFGGGLIPTYIVVNSLHLINTPVVLLVLGLVSSFNIIICRTFISSLPYELQESAKMDGCSDFGILWKIVMPLSKPIIAVLCLYYAVGHWNDYFSAMIYVSDKNLQTLQVFLREILLLNQNIDLETIEDPAVVALKLQMAQVMKYSLIVVASVPLLIAYPFVQKFFVKGVMIGSVKG